MRAVGLLPGLARRLWRRARPPLAGERGFILIIAMILLLVITIAIGAVATAALDVNKQSTRQGQAQLADAAADSGAQVALYRLNTADTTASATGTMANGASYSYTVAALTAPTNACAGLWVQNSSSTLVQDCITSTGTVGNVSERVQMRVVGYAVTATTSLFPVNGVFSVHGFSTTQVGGAFALGSNGPLALNDANLSGITGKIEYLSGELTQSQNSKEMCESTCSLDELSSAITVPPVSQSAYQNAATTNNDLTPGDVKYVDATYSSSTHVITVTSNGTQDNPPSVTFAPGTYYLCGINVGGFNSFAINTTGSGLVSIYIDSPYRSGSTCASGTGDIYDAGNSTSSINDGGTSSDLQLYFYGNPNCTASCYVNPTTNAPIACTSPCLPIISPMNGATIDADIFAPNSAMDPGGAFTMEGALVIGGALANNSFTFTYQAPASGGGGSGGSGSTVSFYPQAHEDCVSSTTTC